MTSLKRFKPSLVAATFVLVAFAAPELRAQDDDSEKALRETQELLKSPALRQQTINSNADAKKADQNLRELGGSQANVEEIYAITADITASLVHQANGDPVKLQELVQEAMKNPEAFHSKLTPAQIQRIKSVSAKIDEQQKKKP